VAGLQDYPQGARITPDNQVFLAVRNTRRKSVSGAT
jgi:hypothetical protein